MIDGLAPHRKPQTGSLRPLHTSFATSIIHLCCGAFAHLHCIELQWLFQLLSSLEFCMRLYT